MTATTSKSQLYRVAVQQGWCNPRVEANKQSSHASTGPDPYPASAPREDIHLADFIERQLKRFGVSK